MTFVIIAEFKINLDFEMDEPEIGRGNPNSLGKWQKQLLFKFYDLIN